MIQLVSVDRTFVNETLKRLPDLSRLFQRGSGVQVLETDLIVVLLRTSFNTGRSPRDHGVYFQSQSAPTTMRLRFFDPEWIGDLTPFWRRGQLGKLRGVVIVPYFALPAPKKAHLDILGWSSHSSTVPFQCSDEAEAARGRSAGAQGRGRMITSARVRGELIPDLAERPRGLHPDKPSEHRNADSDQAERN